MSQPKELCEVIASREMTFTYADGRTEKALARIGKPFEHGEGTDWCCPFEVTMESGGKLIGIHGIDALQALQLAMKALRADIEYWERIRNGKFHFLGEEGAAI